MRKTLLFLTIICFLSSCVPNKDLIYLQGQPVSKKEIHKINNAPYKLQVDDIITIEIMANDKELVSLFLKAGTNNNTSQTLNQSTGYFSGYSVDRHGNIRMPYFGEINVLGYTTKEVRLKIEEKLAEVFEPGEDYFVTVKLDGIKYTIMGEVARPGTNVIYQNRVSILEAITNSGDITVTGNRKSVQVIRFTPTGTKKFEIDLTNIEALSSDVFYIKPNDYINVMPLRQKSWGTGTTGLQSLTTFVSLFTLVTSTILIIRGL
ncbi:MAG: polysaccharide biosynthesis/export family protein [Flavobacteriaceae bacterium]|nr:polysaccharide biosynthesis/export family protein [Flavobacteriaceae bacterium]